MCGICGVYGKATPEAGRSMVAAMTHRGPDDQGIHGDGPVTLGMARLAVIDLSAAAHQPMATPDQMIWIVFNGEIYNSQAERKRLEALGYSFSSRSDTEVVLRLYEHSGDDFLQKLCGMFALAIYDKRKGPGQERLLLARDPLGIKPLLYAEADGRLIFASELKALLASGLIEPEIDPIALRLLLTFGSISQPHSMLKQVKMLMPGERLIAEGGRLFRERYWTLAMNRQPEMRTLPYAQQVERLSAALAAAVRRQMVSDVPMGAFLSGGLDSSLLVALMVRETKQPVRTFSVGFAGEGDEIDESEDAGLTARFLKTDHSHVKVRGSDVKKHILRIAAALDQPSVDGVNSYFISWAARQGMTVAVSGTGGDELFAGYPWFRTLSMEQSRPDSFWARTLAAAARQPAFDGLLQTRLRSPITRFRNMSGFLNRYALQYRIFGATAAAALIAPELRHAAQAGRAEFYDLQPGDELATAPAIERVTALCLRGYTCNQLLRDMDATSMAHSLEVRVPFLDKEIVDLALSLPGESKLLSVRAGDDSYRASGAKRILMDVARPLLPKDFDLRRKRGFAMPFDKWLRGPLQDSFQETVSEASVAKRGWLEKNAVAAVRNDFIEGRGGWARPWLLMMIELWARQVLDRSGG